MILDGQTFFKFCMVLDSKIMVLDVYNRGKLSNLTHLVSRKYFSGHNWTIKALRATAGFAITTNLLGTTVWLDVVVGGEFDGLLTLVPEKEYSGRVWKIKDYSLLNCTYSITTIMDGVCKYLDVCKEGNFENMACLMGKKEFSGNYWKFEKVTNQCLECA